jgi:hypothetical protein
MDKNDIQGEVWGMTTKTKDWKLEDKRCRLMGYEEDIFFHREDIKDFLRRVAQKSGIINYDEYNIPIWAVKLEDIIELAGKSLTESKE